MSALASEISEIERRIAAVDRDLKDRVEAAKETILAAVSEADAAKGSLIARLSHLKAALGTASSEVLHIEIGGSQLSLEAPQIVKPRLTARELILRALRDQGPLSTNTLDSIVIQQGGWTKAASDKAKLLAKRDGLATNEKRIWSITAAGEVELSKFGPQA